MTDETTSETDPFLFYGCIGQLGHFVWKSETERLTRANVWYERIAGFDGRFVSKYRNDVATLVHITCGWGLTVGDSFYMTILAFVDHTVDDRPGSNGMFISVGLLTEEAMIVRARQFFPNVLRRVRPEWVGDG